MMNLFSQFNPLTSQNSSINWIMLALPVMFMMMSTPYWNMTSLPMMMMMKFMMMMMMQFKSLTKKSDYPDLLTITLIMMMILIMNIVGLMPNTFSPTSHIMMNLSMSMTAWTSLMIMKSNNSKMFLSSLTPLSTPTILIPFMVIIEFISSMIQPMTLSIRLTANVMAGHIMMNLISEMYKITPLMALSMNLIMMTMELGISLIQAYVFSMLITMYKK